MFGDFFLVVKSCCKLFFKLLACSAKFWPNLQQ